MAEPSYPRAFTWLCHPKTGLLAPYSQVTPQPWVTFLKPNPVPWSVGRKHPDTLYARRAFGEHLPPLRSGQGGRRGALAFSSGPPLGLGVRSWQRPLPSMPSCWHLIWSTQNLSYQETLTLLLSFPQNSQEKSTAETLNPRTQDAQQLCVTSARM